MHRLLRPWPALPLLLAGLLLQSNPLSAQTTFTWTNASGGLWSAATNWQQNAVPNASGTTANFSTLMLPAAATVDLDASFTVGNLTFGDVTNPFGWTLDNNGIAANTLTLKVASGIPSITVSNQSAEISARLTGTQGLAVAGSGSLLLQAVNTYTGPTEIEGGILNGLDGVGLPKASNLQLAGGLFESNGLFTRTLGTAAGDVQWTSSGGFSAQGGELDIKLNNSTNTVTWNAGGLPATGVAMLFNAASSDSLLNFENGINLAAAAQTINVGDNPNSTTDLAELSGVLTNGGLIKTGSGVLFLNAANNYAKPTAIDAGALRAVDGSSLPLTSNLTLAGGVLESSGIFTRTVGTAAADVQWTLSGGFSAQGGELDIRLNNSTAALIWGSGSFVPTGQTLILNAASSDSLLNFENGINLVNAARTIEVVDNINST